MEEMRGFPIEDTIMEAFQPFMILQAELNQEAFINALKSGHDKMMEQIEREFLIHRSANPRAAWSDFVEILVEQLEPQAAFEETIFMELPSMLERAKPHNASSLPEIVLLGILKSQSENIASFTQLLANVIYNHSTKGLTTFVDTSLQQQMVSIFHKACQIQASEYYHVLWFSKEFYKNLHPEDNLLQRDIRWIALVYFTNTKIARLPTPKAVVHEVEKAFVKANPFFAFDLDFANACVEKYWAYFMVPSQIKPWAMPKELSVKGAASPMPVSKRRQLQAHPLYMPFAAAKGMVKPLSAIFYIFDRYIDGKILIATLSDLYSHFLHQKYEPALFVEKMTLLCDLKQDRDIFLNPGFSKEGYQDLLNHQRMLKFVDYNNRPPKPVVDVYTALRSNQDFLQLLTFTFHAFNIDVQSVLRPFNSMIHTLLNEPYLSHNNAVSKIQEVIILGNLPLHKAFFTYFIPQTYRKIIDCHKHIARDMQPTLKGLEMIPFMHFQTMIYAITKKTWEKTIQVKLIASGGPFQESIIDGFKNYSVMNHDEFLASLKMFHSKMIKRIEKEFSAYLKVTPKADYASFVSIIINILREQKIPHHDLETIKLFFYQQKHLLTTHLYEPFLIAVLKDMDVVFHAFMEKMQNILRNYSLPEEGLNVFQKAILSIWHEGCRNQAREYYETFWFSKVLYTDYFPKDTLLQREIRWHVHDYFTNGQVDEKSQQAIVTFVQNAFSRHYPSAFFDKDFTTNCITKWESLVTSQPSLLAPKPKRPAYIVPSMSPLRPLGTSRRLPIPIKNLEEGKEEEKFK